MEAMRFLERMPQRFPFFEETYIPTNKYHKMILEIVYGAAVMVIGLAELIQNPVLIFL